MKLSVSYQSSENGSYQTGILSFEEGTLCLRNISHGFIGKTFPSGLWQWDGRSGYWRTDALHYNKVLERLKQKIEDKVPSWKGVSFSRIDLPELRPEQTEAVNQWNKQKRGVIVMPTGTGKTEIALSMMSALECATLIIAPVRDLMYQWHRRIDLAFGFDAGIVGDGQCDVRAITVTTYDSAAIHMNKLGNQFQLVIFDECHHLPGKFFREAALMSAAPFRLGLTATPKRSDGKHDDLSHLIGPILYHLPLSKVKGKTLADYDIVRIGVRLSSKEQTRYDYLCHQIRQFMIAKRKEKSDYSWKNLLADSGTDPASRSVQKAFYAKQAIEDRADEKLRVLEDIFRLHFGSRIIVFTGSNAMARAVSLRFCIPCILSHCKKEERKDILEGFSKGKYPAIVANRVLDEGVDVPSAKVAVVLGGLGSARQAVQRLGRVLRKKGNQRAVLYEVVCQSTREENTSRRRRRSEAYSKVKRKFNPDN